MSLYNEIESTEFPHQFESFIYIAASTYIHIRKSMKGKAGKSKQKPAAITKQQPAAEAEIQKNQTCCAVCRFAILPNANPKSKTRAGIKCEACKKEIHPACYGSESVPNDKPFTCDLCRSEKRKATCFICQKGDNMEMLKSVEGGGLAHVECAVYHGQVQIESYVRLNFSCRNLQKVSSGCTSCNKVSHGVAVECLECNTNGHLRCFLAKERCKEPTVFMISRWLDKCERYDYLLNYLFSKTKTILKELVQCAPKNKEGRLLVCEKHSENYPWCPCDDRSLNNQKQDPAYECQKCGRYYHRPCSGLPKDCDQAFICPGCTEPTDIFKRELKLHELFIEAAKVEKIKNFSQYHVRFLNAFPFKFSKLMEEKITNNISVIEAYYIKRQILREIEAPRLSEKATKKIINLLLYITYGEKFKDYEGKLQRKDQQAGKIIEDICSFKRIAFYEKATQKIKSLLLNFKPKEKRKQQEALIQELKKFLQKWKDIESIDSKTGCHEIASSLKQIRSKFQIFLKAEPANSKFLQRFEKMMQNQIFGLFLLNDFQQETLEQIIRRYSKIKYYSRSGSSIPEHQYWAVLSQEQSSNLAPLQKPVFNKLMKLIKDFSSQMVIAYNSIKKQNLYSRKKQMLEGKRLNHVEVIKLQNQSNTEGVYLMSGQDSSVALAELTSIQHSLYKKKLLQLAKIKDSQISDRHFGLIGKIRRFTDTNKAIFTLEERKQIENFLHKLQFLSEFNKKFDYLALYFSTSNQDVGQNQDENVQEAPNPIFKKVYNILDYWNDERFLSNETIVKQIWDRLVSRKIKFDSSQIYDKLQGFLRRTMQNIEKIMDQNIKITICFVRTMKKIIKQLGLEGSFAWFQEIYQQVKQWLEIMPPTQKITDLNTLFEKPDKIATLHKTIEHKILTASEITKVHIGNELRKLYVARQWCKLTEKIALIYKSKPTINAVQILKSCMDKANFPRNGLHRKISDLEQQGRKLNVEISKFLEKPRFVQQINFFEEIKFVTNKLSHEQGLAIRKILQNCNLDVSVQNQQLSTEIKEYKFIKEELEKKQYHQQKPYHQYRSIRRRVIDCCFKPDRIDDYEKFLKKFYIFRCVNFEPPITKQEYFELLSIAGASAIEFENKTKDLLRAYQEIDRAERELVGSNGRKRNYANLIPYTEEKLKQMRHALRYDQEMLMRFDKARAHNRFLRQEYHHYFTEDTDRKADPSRLKQLEMELNQSIFNNRQVVNNIAELKKQLASLVRKVESTLPYGSDAGPPNYFIDNIFKKSEQILQNYDDIGILHPSLQKFYTDCKYYRQASQIRAELSPQNYHIYCQTIYKISQAGRKETELVNMRLGQFYRMCEFVQKSQEPHMHLYQAIIEEGLQLRVLRPPLKDKLMEKVVQIYTIIHKYTEPGQQKSQSKGNSPRSESEEENQDGLPRRTLGRSRDSDYNSSQQEGSQMGDSYSEEDEAEGEQQQGEGEEQEESEEEEEEQDRHSEQLEELGDLNSQLSSSSPPQPNKKNGTSDNNPLVLDDSD